jgi:superfamily II DNA or RNA helicase
MIQRFSSRRQRLDHHFLRARLNGAQAYDRIAGYFSSSILEIAGEELEAVNGQVRMVCNSQLDVLDVETARAAKIAMQKEWCASQPEQLSEAAKPRFQKLYQLLSSGKLCVKVVPDEGFGLIHGKAGVITMTDGIKTSFIGSSNETSNAWKLNYELIWEDDSADAVQWVQAEFDSLWTSPYAVDLADFVVQDLERLTRRAVISTIKDWREIPEPAAIVIEAPVYRQEIGLWEHQKYFIKMAFDAHMGPFGARFVLADMVGLGKTLQLAISAELMALKGDKPVLILAPKTLLEQWQDEMKNLLQMPSARWNGRQWIDENGIMYPALGPEGIKQCPRRVGLVSHSVVVSKTPAVEYLLDLKYECLIVDEAHRARRRNLGISRENEKPDPNNLLAFLHQVSPRTRSLLLATATPVQLYPVEAWDLLYVLALGSDAVLGNDFSNWRHANEALRMAMGEPTMPEDNLEAWMWIRNPMPPSSEGRDIAQLRRSLNLADDCAVCPGDAYERLKSPDKARLRRLSTTFATYHNPFIRRIVRRTREFLENTIDPETKEPFLKPVRVELFGESDSEAIRLPVYLREAYTLAEEFCQMLAARLPGAGFLKTLLLRRVGSTIAAGQITAQRMLGTWQAIEEVDEDEEDSETINAESRTLTPAEREKLQAFSQSLEANQERDPKFAVVRECLMDRGWLEMGCIIFSQFFDSLRWLGFQLSTELLDEKVGIYAGGEKSGVLTAGEFKSCSREQIKAMVNTREIRVLLGTDAASEGLNLQRLGTLINLDLPWNPTRLEQRKGRIQRIGQTRDIVSIYNMRYKDSVEDHVHHLLSERLENIHRMFGQLPDVLEDVWIEVAQGHIDRAKQIINAIPKKHPFDIRWNKIEKVPWESCARVLESKEKRAHLSKGWTKQ